MDSEALAAPVQLLQCPSDGGVGGAKFDTGDFTGYWVGITNYKAVMGANWGHDASQNSTDIGTDWPNPGTNGSWDGLKRGDGIMFRTDMALRRGFNRVSDGLSNTFMVGEDVPELDRWCSWPYSTHAYSTCAIPLNVKSGGGSYDPGWWPNVQGFRSGHSGGAFFCYADGSTHFIADSIELAAYRSQATIAGQEPR
jgi:hypothetical protein